ncbi:hypothetical protein [Chitinophaga filiformis]|uniref:Transposase n=1 Tax=Chitinophaga filiformis TaxID=104663 RepID=A0ABY4HYK6_CHIFI|nr:hypothetical protein [Chitinophaga filiformis]UPK68018.1 hypothetical protein MYF79_23990 [Chitinophaga filiformis]
MMKEQTPAIILEIEWCNVQRQLARQRDPGTQKLRDAFPTLEQAFQQLRTIHDDLFDARKVHKIGLPAYIRRASIYQGGALLLQREKRPSIQATIPGGAHLLVPAEKLSVGLLKTLGPFIAVLQTDNGYMLQLPEKKVLPKRLRVQADNKNSSGQRRNRKIK